MSHPEGGLHMPIGSQNTLARLCTLSQICTWMSFWTSSFISVLSTLNSLSGSSTAAFTCKFKTFTCSTSYVVADWIQLASYVYVRPCHKSSQSFRYILALSAAFYTDLSDNVLYNTLSLSVGTHFVNSCKLVRSRAQLGYHDNQTTPTTGGGAGTCTSSG